MYHLARSAAHASRIGALNRTSSLPSMAAAVSAWEQRLEIWPNETFPARAYQQG